MSNSTQYDFQQLDPYQYWDDNCNSIMEIWNYLQYNLTGQAMYWVAYRSQETVYKAIMQGFEAVRNGSLEKPPMNQEFWDWSVNGSYLHLQVGNFAWEKCDNRLCEALGWEGSPDIAGVGMLATYIIQAILITVYLCGILTVNLNQQLNQPRMWPPLSDEEASSAKHYLPGTPDKPSASDHTKENTQEYGHTSDTIQLSFNVQSIEFYISIL
ncbi:sorting nexin-41 [Alternaria burnsii]|uniref:Sorting nexin-41 n=1 Tax=Alternaria burnsii TaxID=1187904 RepID=A0A8H7EBK2_9PLEO|nr:sorting nexin-41 [Alternaria burnsii]KAF7671900.1 sorting nexin-41 [Alternaria burnsii]